MLSLRRSSGGRPEFIEGGIERPKLRRGSAIANQNTLIYVLLNLRGYHRVCARRAELSQGATPTAGGPRPARRLSGADVLLTFGLGCPQPSPLAPPAGCGP